MNLSGNLLEVRNVSKIFPGVQALEGVDFNVNCGEVHVLLGENGAGKSTLIKIISGAYQPDSGSIFFKGKKVHENDPRNSLQMGVSVLYQEPSLVPNLNLIENIHLGIEPELPSLLTAIDEKKQLQNTLALFDELNLALDPYAQVLELNLAEQQMVAIARALHLSANLVIFDEPAAMLAQREVTQLFSVIRQLRARGLGIIYVTHRLEEAMQIGDRASIMRDGHMVATVAIDGTTKKDLVRMIVGHGVEDSITRISRSSKEEILRLEKVSSKEGITDVSFNLHAGEILGITGLIGSGGTDLLQTIFGVNPVISGKIFMRGKEVKILSPQDAISLGIGFITEDRQNQGLILEMNAQENMTIASLDDISMGQIIDLQAENQIVEHYASRLNINPLILSGKSKFLSGGTQQKVVLSRWLARNCQVLLLDEPSRGVDVGSRAELYRLLNELTKRGTSMILVSSNIPEILTMADRIVVLRQGRIVKLLNRYEATHSAIMNLVEEGAVL